MFTSMRKRLALLLAVATLGAVAAIVPSTAGAASLVNPNAGGTDLFTAPTPGVDVMEACPTGSASAAGFTDTTSTDVDCIKMFGVTTGRTATTFDPAGSVTRQDMARFIHRLFVPAGVAAAGATVLPVFTDTAHVTQDGLDAIDALASHAITTGLTTTTFSPDTNVTRAQMAAFLNRFANIAKDHAGAAIATIAIGSQDGTYNYSDLGTVTAEEKESIIRLFNIGVTEGTCTAGAASTCSSTYRPADDITRAEMASMLVNLLNHTNARPAGVSTQPSVASATVGTATDTLISVRGTDFTVTANALVDEFYQNHNDAVGVAAQAPFDGLGVCTTNVTKSASGGTKCVIDANDASTNVYGNVAGTTITTAASKTANWWVHTGDSGQQYIDGTTSAFFKYSVAFGATATAAVHADTTVITNSATNALTINHRATQGLVTATDGIAVSAGNSVTFTATMSKSTALTSTIVDGYTFKVATKEIDQLGNITNTTAYYPSSAGVASWTVTCPADNTLTDLLYLRSYEMVVTMGTAAGGTGIPANASPANPIASVSGNLDVSCDDTLPAVQMGAAGSEALAISSNNYAISTAGTLASVTATAYDQYGAGKSGVTVTLQSDTDGAGPTTRATLLTGANGTATLTAVVCATGIETVAWSVVDAGGAAEMDNITATDPGSSTSAEGEGTTMYCTTAGTDGVPNAATVREVKTITFDQDITAADAGKLVITYGGQTATQTVTANGQLTHTSIASLINGLSTVAGAACTTGGAAAPTLITCTWAANTGVIGTLTAAHGSPVLSDTGATNISVITVLQDGTGASTEGVNRIVHTFLDDDPGANNLYTIHTTTQAGADGAAADTLIYKSWNYDSTDVLNTTAVPGSTEAQWEAANAALVNNSAVVTISYRTGATTSGVSVFTVN